MADKTSAYLAQNLQKLRASKNMSQQQLSRLSGVPRTTLTHIESGEGNPSLSNLVRISGALGVGIEELLSRPRTESFLLKAKDVPVTPRSQGRVQIHKLLPDKIKGIEIDRMEFSPEASMGGHPHLEGTKEYLYVLGGQINVHLSGEVYEVRAGDVLAFAGNQPHSYRNPNRSQSSAISVVIPVPVFV